MTTLATPGSRPRPGRRAAAMLLGAGLLATALASAAQAWRRGEAAPPAVAGAAAAPAATDALAPAAAAAAAAPAPPPAAAPIGGAVARFPDGSTQPALNDVATSVAIPWPAGRPFAPVVGTEVHDGTRWFRHQDGTFTTTVRRPEAQSGALVDIGLCATPQAAPAARRRALDGG